jgi:nickel-dependent lactate racemase
MGWMHNNPFHELSVQIAQAAGVDFIVNVVKNWRGQVVQTVAGDLVAAHEAGVWACEQNWVVNLPQKYDVVVVTPGGYPRDIDLHQAQKAISAAEQAVAEGGVIVLIAACPEGAGKFIAWFENARSPQEIIDRFKQEGFTREQSSKAFMCARALNDHRVIVACSGITRHQLETMFFQHAASPQEAINQALAYAGPQGSLLILPYAIDCVPKILNPSDSVFY